ncbi:MAG: hypothetical protein V3U84_06365 [Thiotrichaceae bacterium]
MSNEVISAEKTLTVSRQVSLSFEDTSSTSMDIVTLREFNPAWGHLTGVNSSANGGSWGVDFTNRNNPEGSGIFASGSITAILANQNMASIGGNTCGLDIMLGTCSMTPPIFVSPGESQSISGGMSNSQGRTYPSSNIPRIDFFEGDDFFNVAVTGSLLVKELSGPRGSVRINSGFTNATLSINYDYIAPDIKAIQLNNGEGVLFSNELIVLPQSGNGQIASIGELVGTVTIVRASGEREAAALGSLLSVGDTVETDVDAAADLVFNGGSSHIVREGESLNLSEYVYDDENSSGSSFFDILKGAFIYNTSGVLGEKDLESKDIEAPIGVLGIRGDAGEIIKQSIDPLGLNQREIAALDETAILTTGSPIELYTAVDVPDAPFTLGFDYGFLDETGSLEIYIGDFLVFASSASIDNQGNIFSTSVDIDDGLISNLDNAELSFLFDGESGSRLLLDDIIFAGLENGDFSSLGAGWFSEGAGEVALVGLLETSAVPIPAAVWLFGSGLLGLIGVANFNFRGRRDPGLS